MRLRKQTITVALLLEMRKQIEDLTPEETDETSRYEIEETDETSRYEIEETD